MSSSGKCLICEGLLSEEVTREVKEKCKSVDGLKYLMERWRIFSISRTEKISMCMKNVGNYIRKEKALMKLFKKTNFSSTEPKLFLRS